MQIFNTLPQKESFYKFYAKFGRGIAASVIALQIVSAITEGTAGYIFMYHSLVFFGEQIGIIAGIITAIAVVMAVEVAGIRFFLPLIVRSILHRKFSGLEAWMTGFAIFGTVCLLGLSGFASWSGAKSAVEVFSPEAEQQTTVTADSTHEANLTAIRGVFSTDSTTLAEQYETLIQAEKAAYSAKIKAANADVKRWEQKQATTGRNYVSRIEGAKVKAAELEGEQGAKVAALESQKAAELASLKKRTTYKADSLQNVYSNTLSTIKLENKEAISEVEATKEKNKKGFAIVAGIICLILSIVGITMHEIYKHGSGIEEDVSPTEWDYRKGIFFEMLQAWNHRFKTWSYSRIDAYNKKTRTASIPTLRPIVYDRRELYGNNVVILKAPEQPDGQQQQVVYIQNPTLPNASTMPQQPTGNTQANVGSILNAIAGTPETESFVIDQNGHRYRLSEQQVQELILGLLQRADTERQSGNETIANKCELNANEVIKMYLERTGAQATAKDIQAFRRKILEHLNDSSNPNPFAEIPRTIGFHTGNNSQPQEPVNNNPVSNSMGKNKHFEPRACDHCGNMYEPKAWNQRFCSNKGTGNCKTAWHEQQHGQRFNPKQYHRSKNRAKK